MRIAVGMYLVMAALTAAAADLKVETQSIDGEPVTVDRGLTTAVCFLGTECPMAKAYASTLSQLQEQYRDQGVQIVGVMSNVQDSEDDVREYAREHDARFPIVHDIGNRLADRFGATRTPEVFLIDENLRLRYHGRIDDRYAPGVARAQATRQDLALAIEQLLSGEEIAVTETRALGCVIGRATQVGTAEDTAQNRTEAAGLQSVVGPTFTRDVLPVLNRHCVECHRQGEIGPFAMEEYEDVAGWAETMIEVIDAQRMPPWHAAPEYGEFSNARDMPGADVQILRDWIAAGKPPGDPEDAPPPPEFTDGWQLTEAPDEEYAMRDRPFRVPADGVVEYQYFVVDPGFTEDRWVAEAQVIPGRRSVVHHAIVFVRPPDGVDFQGIGWLTAYVPGQRLLPLPPGHARRVPAGSKFVFQMHYTPDGAPREDISRLGLVFADRQQVTHEVFTLAALEQEFEIPPGAAAHRVTAAVRNLPVHSRLLAATPHMHFRGSSFELRADNKAALATANAAAAHSGSTKVLESANEEILLSVPNYDFNWQHTYHFADPLDLNSIERLWFTATFDNSAANPFNPDPRQWVTWGDQTWEEMAVAFFEVARPVDVQSQPRSRDSRAGASDEQAGERYVTRVMAALDADGDGRIRKGEAPIVVRHSGFWNWDHNGDEVITRDEVQTTAERLFR